MNVLVKGFVKFTKEGICPVFCRRYLLNHYITHLNYLTNQVVLSHKILTLPMVSWFFRLCHNSYVFTKQYHTLQSQRYFPLKSHEELSKLNDFFYCFKSCNIFISIVASIMQDCFTLFQLRVVPPKVNTKPKIDL